jgi:DNA modification methylase
MEIKKLKDLTPDSKNANKGSERGQSMIENSLRQYGAGRSILIDKNGVIIAGNKTAENAGSIGLEDVIVVQSDGTKLVAVQRTDLDLTKDKAAKELAIADNRSNQVSLDFDIDVLKELGEEIDLEKFWTTDELGTLLAIEILPAELLGDEDSVPEVPEEPVTRPGDLYVLGHHRLLCGDSMVITDVERLMGGEKADMVWTDPPYGVNFQSGMSKGGTATRFDKLKNDDVILDVMPVIEIVLRNDGAAFVWTSHQVYPQWREQFEPIYKGTIIWHKPGGGIGDLKGNYAADYEMCLFCVKGRVHFRGKRGMAVWRVTKDQVLDYAHPTQKPVELAERAILDFSDPGYSVLDLFGGSGTTMIACEKLGRRARLMELDCRYVDVILNRWSTATGKDPIREDGISWSSLRGPR